MNRDISSFATVLRARAGPSSISLNRKEGQPKSLGWERRTDESAAAEVEIRLSPLVNTHLVTITDTNKSWTNHTPNPFDVMKGCQVTMMKYLTHSTLEVRLHHLPIGEISNGLFLRQRPMTRPSSGWDLPPRHMTHPRSRPTTSPFNSKRLTPVPLLHIDLMCMILTWAIRHPPCSTISPFLRL